MSGHSKWATTKHKKAVVDARRGKLFAKLIKNVEVAARTGGADRHHVVRLGDDLEGLAEVVDLLGARVQDRDEHVVFGQPGALVDDHNALAAEQV